MKRSEFEKLALRKVRRLTAGATDHEHPAWSPDGRSLAFAAGPVDVRRVFVVDRRGRFAYAIAPGGPHASRPRWAPDGRRLAFDARPVDAPPLVLVQELPEVGLEARPLVRARSPMVAVAASVAAASRETPEPGSFSSLEGEGPHFAAGAAAIHAAFSPDGRLVAYASNESAAGPGSSSEPGLFHLWALDLESGARRQLTDEASANDAHPAFSPDGSLLAFHRYLGENATQSSLFILNVASGALLRLTDARGFDKHPSFANDAVILYHREHPDGTQDLRAVHVVEGHEISLTRRRPARRDPDDEADEQRASPRSDSIDAKQPAVRVTRKGGVRVAFAGRRRGTVAGSPRPYDLHVGDARGSVKIAAIDVGSNSIHMVIVRRHDDGRIEVMDREKEMVRLASGALEKPALHGANAARGVLAPDRIEAGLACLRKFSKLAERHQVDALVAAATSAVREAENGGDFINLALERTGIRIDVLPAREEARIIYLAAREAVELQGRRALFVDIGGGSVEITVGDVRRRYISESMKLGVIRLAERFLHSDPPTAKEIAELQAFVDQEVGAVLAGARRMEFSLAIGTSGTIAALCEAAALRRSGRASSDTGQIRLPTLGVDELSSLVHALAAMPERERAKVPGVHQRRAATIVAGGLLLERILKLAGARSIVPCDRALREGLVIDYLEKNRERLALLQEHRSPRERSVFELARRSGFDRAHSLHVMRLARELFDQLRGVHELKARDRELLEDAAVLHDVGQSISFARHHKHSYYLIRNADLQGFDPDEVETMALLARYHRKGPPRRGNAAYRDLSPERRDTVRGLAALLRVADALDRSHFQVCTHVGVKVNPREVRLRVITAGEAEIELWAATRKGDFFEEVFGRRLRVEAETRPARDAVRDSTRLATVSGAHSPGPAPILGSGNGH